VVEDESVVDPVPGRKDREGRRGMQGLEGRDGEWCGALRARRKEGVQLRRELDVYVDRRRGGVVREEDADIRGIHSPASCQGKITVRQYPRACSPWRLPHPYPIQHHFTPRALFSLQSHDHGRLSEILVART
jgi:hypothetical protein